MKKLISYPTFDGKIIQAIVISGLAFCVCEGMAVCQNSSTATSAMARGDQANAVPSKGSFVHRWIGKDGLPYVMVNGDPKELTEQDRHDIEASLNMTKSELETSKANLQTVEANLKAAAAELDSHRKQLERAKKALSGYDAVSR
jgi:hypothetical protein